MLQDIANSSDQIINFCNGMGKFFWETGEVLLDIFLEFCRRSIELVVAVLTLGLGVICFIRDCCVDSMQTFSNAIRGVINVIGGIDCEDIEDFASACFVVVLWIGAGKFILSAMDKTKGRYNPMYLLERLLRATMYDKLDHDMIPCPVVENTWSSRHRTSSRKKNTGNRRRRSSKRR